MSGELLRELRARWPNGVSTEGSMTTGMQRAGARSLSEINS